MSEFSAQIDPQANFTAGYVVCFKGAFDADADSGLKTVEDLIRDCPEGMVLIFDLGKLDFLNSYAIGHLVGWHMAVQKKSGQIAVAGANPNVTDIFNIVGINNLFKIFPDVETAKAAFKK